jgi:hypothetical protein
MMRYNVDEEPPCSDLSIFASRDTTVGSSMSYYSTTIIFIYNFFHFVYFFVNIVLTTYSLKQDVKTPG